MKKGCMISPFKFIVSILTSIAALLITATQVLMGEWIGVLLFAAIGIMFLAEAAVNGSQLILNETGIQKTFLFFNLWFIPWSDIAEVGVIGTRVFCPKPDKTGMRYIYFSEEKLDEDSRFKLALEWPPRRMPYLSYTKERLSNVQFLWAGPIASYQAGDLY